MIPQIIGAVVLFGGWQLLRRRFVNNGNRTWEAGRRREREQYLASERHKPKHFPTVETVEEYIINGRQVEIFTKRWIPVNKTTIRAVIFYCHGYSDTCTYAFDDVAHQLASAGYAVFAMDYEGFGLSAGLHCYVPSFNSLLDDVVEFTSKLKDDHEWGKHAFYLLGESMGGAVAIQLHRKMPKAFDGAVLLAPMCKIAEAAMPPPFLGKIVIALAPLLPKWRLVPQKDISELGFRDPDKRLFLASNYAAFRSGPRMRTAVELLLTTEDIAAHLKEVEVPLLILHGQKDRVCDYSVSEALYEEASSTDKTLKLYPDSWHGLLVAEPDEVASVVMGDVISWLNQRTKAPWVAMMTHH